jgi:hypothetical protein
LEYSAEAAAAGDACNAAKAMFNTAHLFRILFTILVFAFGLALTILLIVALYILVTGGADGRALASGGGAVASGIATVWLLARMREAIKEEKAAAGRSHALQRSESPGVARR